MATGQNPVPPVNLPVPSEIGSNGCTYPKLVPFGFDPRPYPLQAKAPPPRHGGELGEVPGSRGLQQPRLQGTALGVAQGGAWRFSRPGRLKPGVGGVCPFGLEGTPSKDQAKTQGKRRETKGMGKPRETKENQRETKANQGKLRGKPIEIHLRGLNRDTLSCTLSAVQFHRSSPGEEFPKSKFQRSPTNRVSVLRLRVSQRETKPSPPRDQLLSESISTTPPPPNPQPPNSRKWSSGVDSSKFSGIFGFPSHKSGNPSPTSGFLVERMDRNLGVRKPPWIQLGSGRVLCLPEAIASCVRLDF